jgi:hypothetical protein
MQNQYIQHGSTTPSVNIKFVVPSTGLSANGLTNATAGLTIAYSRPGAANANITLAAQTVTGAYTPGGFVLRGDGVYRLDLPTAAVLTGVTQLTLLAPALPADVAMVAAIVQLGPDDVSVASPTTNTIRDAVWAASSRELTAISVSIREAFADTLLGRAVAGGANGGRTVARALMKHVNRWLLSGSGNNTLSNYAADDTTVLSTETLTRDSNGNIIGSDPA